MSIESVTSLFAFVPSPIEILIIAAVVGLVIRFMVGFKKGIRDASGDVEKSAS